MTRRLTALACALLVAPVVVAQDEAPADPVAAYAEIEALIKARPANRAEMIQKRREATAKLNAFLAEWEPKAEATASARLPLAKANLSLAAMNYRAAAKATKHLDAAESHLQAHNEAFPDQPDSKLTKAIESFRGVVAKQAKAAERRAAAKAKRDALVGEAAPAITFDEVLDGEAMTLEQHRGKVVLLDFWATWCGPCRRVIPHLVELKKTHGDDLVVLGVTRFYKSGYVPGKDGARGQSHRNLEPEAEREVNRKCAEALGINYPIVFSTDGAKAYGVTGIPQLVVIDKQGVVRHIKVGAGDTSKVDELIKTCLAEDAASK